MLREPRGYPASCCNLILPPTDSRADAGYVIMEQVEYPGMSGTNTIAVATVLIETGMVPHQEPVTELTLESPAGLIGIRADVEAGKVKRVTFENVPAFPVYLDAEVEVPELGKIRVDVAHGVRIQHSNSAGRSRSIAGGADIDGGERIAKNQPAICKSQSVGVGERKIRADCDYCAAD